MNGFNCTIRLWMIYSRKYLLNPSIFQKSF